MAKLKYYNPETFEEKDVDVDDFIIEITNKFQKTELPEGYQATSIITRSEDNILVFGIMGHREVNGPTAEKYRITIEKFYSK